MSNGKKFLIIAITALAMIGAGVPEAYSEDAAENHTETRTFYLDKDYERNPLKPPETSSPRATLHSFLENMNRAYRVLMAAHNENMKAPGLFTSGSVIEMGRKAEELFDRGVYCLDLSEVPKAIRDEMGDVRALELKEILDRIHLSHLDAIPDAKAIKNEREQKNGLELLRWRVPDTDIVIARVEKGPRKGEYLFSPDTVERLDTFYNKVKHLPYRSEAITSDGFLDFYSRTPGRLLPPKWYRWLPVWATREYLGQTLWQWAAYIAALILICVANIVLFRKLLVKTPDLSLARRRWGQVIMALFAFGTLIFLYFFAREINITGSVLFVSRRILVPIFWALLATGIFFFGQAISESIIASPKIDPKGIQASYLRAVFGVFGFLGFAIMIVFGLSRVGISLIPLLTGLGIGGLAVALAARPTLENIISGFMIFLDKPFRVGHRIKVLGQDGIVQSIGLRSTKIRLLAGPQLSIPNKLITDKEIQNLARREYIRRRFSILIPQETPPEKINRAVEILKEILSIHKALDSETGDGASNVDTRVPTEDNADKGPHPNEAINQPNRPPRVYFDELNPDSLSILVIYWYKPPKVWDYKNHAHWVNIQIIERFKAEGIPLYMPTQRLHLADDDTRPLTIGQRKMLMEEAMEKGNGNTDEEG
jgi:MscS family membrane protein